MVALSQVQTGQGIPLLLKDVSLPPPYTDSLPDYQVIPPYIDSLPDSQVIQPSSLHRQSTRQSGDPTLLHTQTAYQTIR